MPGPAITVRGAVDRSQRHELAAVFEAAVAPDALKLATSELLIDGCVRTTIADYVPTLDLAAI